MNFFSDRINRIKPSPSIAAKALVDKLRAEGRDIVDFTIGEPDLATPSHVIEAAVTALRDGDTKYTGSSGTPQLRKAIAEKLARDNGLDYSAENVVVGTGGKHIIFHALAVTLNHGDEVIIPAPFWVSYPDIVMVNEGIPVIVTGEASDGFKLSPQALEAAITPRTKWLILNSPNNPTGAVYTAEEFVAIGEVLERHPHVWLMSDEIYEHFVYGDARHVSPVQAIPGIKERCLVVNGASKGYCMTGFRIGFGAAPVPLIKAITKLITQTTTCPSSVSQAAAIAAFSESQDAPRQAGKIFEARGRLMAELLGGARGMAVEPPRGAFYLFPSVAGLLGKKTRAGSILQTDLDVVRYFSEEAGVATLDGTAYGVAPYLRLSFATSEDAIREGCRRIVQACAALK
ncbi:pyridoxal phosphate-dependent aminotransferase [Paraburkholderia sp. BL17N1]|uniref:pyridoxal phosphate-dependent aminotransferase n=1 Tax=Paraburkholderia sp. BL17N1 TaxID=1938798 RepID=UPI000EAFD10C|nr:pyridoxal phosphate-dependent aminotransferase [Paraburkholderia sp. BL17N1]RKR36154.1 aspartate aminotransferase [Paraburkholderia sp. BL17N1]